MDLLNTSRKDKSMTYTDMAIRFTHLLLEANIKAMALSGELIINRLIRSVKNPYERPDFSKEKLEPYMIYTVSRALERNKSPLIGISFQNIKRQLLSDELYQDRNGTSYIDEFYRTEISTDNLKKYDRIVKGLEEAGD